MSQPVCFWKLLEVVEGLRVRGQIKTWQAALSGSQDLRAAEERQDVAGARTAIAAVTMRRFPVSSEIPAQVLGTLNAMGVLVRW